MDTGFSGLADLRWRSSRVFSEAMHSALRRWNLRWRETRFLNVQRRLIWVLWGPVVVAGSLPGVGVVAVAHRAHVEADLADGRGFEVAGSR